MSSVHRVEVEVGVLQAIELFVPSDGLAVADDDLVHNKVVEHPCGLEHLPEEELAEQVVCLVAVCDLPEPGLFKQSIKGLLLQVGGADHVLTVTGHELGVAPEGRPQGGEAALKRGNRDIGELSQGVLIVIGGHGVDEYAAELPLLVIQDDLSLAAAQHAGVDLGRGVGLHGRGVSGIMLPTGVGHGKQLRGPGQLLGGQMAAELVNEMKTVSHGYPSGLVIRLSSFGDVPELPRREIVEQRPGGALKVQDVHPAQPAVFDIHVRAGVVGYEQ